MASARQFQFFFQLTAALGPNFSKTFKTANSTMTLLGDNLKEVRNKLKDVSAYQKQQTAVERSKQRVTDLSQYIVFKVSANKVRTFDDLKIDSKTNYAKHTRHLKKPLLEFQYNDADTASLTIYLSAFLGVNPKKMQNKIDKYRKKGKILTLVIGGKKYGSQWVITGHTKDYEKFDNQGNLLIAKSTLSLEQYAKR